MLSGFIQCQTKEHQFSSVRMNIFVCLMKNEKERIQMFIVIIVLAFITL